MRSRNNNYHSSQTQIKLSPESLKNGPLEGSYHSNQVQNALKQIDGKNKQAENFETPPRYKKYLGRHKHYADRDCNQDKGGWQERKKLDFNQNQNQSQTSKVHNNDYHKYKDENQQKYQPSYEPNVNEDTKATKTTKPASISKPTGNQNENDRQRDRDRQRERVSHSSSRSHLHPHKRHCSGSSYRNHHQPGQHESETKWDNERHQNQENRNRNRNNPNISKNNNSYNSRQNRNTNNYRRSRYDHKYDEDVANSDYHALEKWNGGNANRDKNKNGKNYRQRGYQHEHERDYGRSNYDDYNRRNNRRRLNSYSHSYSSRGSEWVSRDRDRSSFNYKGSSNVCKFYNPYFKSGCLNERCPYDHLTPDEFLIYCKFIRKSSDIDSFSQKKFDDALAYIKEGMSIKAFYIFRHLVHKYEYDALCNFWLGRCHQLFDKKSREDLECAKFYYQKAIALKPDNASFRAYYADFMIETARIRKRSTGCYEHKQARIHILKAIELKPSGRFYLQYAKLLDEIEGEFFEAKKYYKLALEIYESDTRIRLNYARLLHKMGNLRAAKQEFGVIFDTLKQGGQKYKALTTRWLWPHFHYARLLVDMQYHESAKKEFELCIQIQEHHNNKFFSEIYHEFAKLLFNTFNDNDHAYYYVNKAVSQAPHKHIYKKLLYAIQDAYYNQGQDNSASKDMNNNPAQEHKDEEHRDHEPTYDDREYHEPAHQQPEQRETPNTNTNTNPGQQSPSNDTNLSMNQRPKSANSGFGFGAQYDHKMQHVNEDDVNSYNYNHTDEDNYGVPDEHQDGDNMHDCAASFGRLSLSFGSYTNAHNNDKNDTNAFAGFNQKEAKPKTPTNVFVDDINNNTKHDIMSRDLENEESQNKNEASLEIPMNPQNPEMENRFCATEFDRFISSDALFGNELEKYCDKFEDEGVNDIRWLLNVSAMDDKFLQTKIKMSSESIILWKKSVNIFRNQYNIYCQWLQSNNFKRTYFPKFQVYGILNLESFFYYIKNKEDVLYMIGDENKRDADIIWRSAQNEYSQTQKSIQLNLN